MQTDFTQSIVLMTSQDSNNHSMGTGFVVHRDGQGTYLVTCAHVVESVGGTDQVSLHGHQAEVIALLPIVIITSNKEKGNLPMPFLRRCIYHLVHFPDAEHLKDIIDIHYHIKESKAPPAKLVRAAIQRFQHIRAKGGLHKNPGTSEFLDWIEVLQHFESPPHKASQIENPDSILPYPEVLYKLRADWPRGRTSWSAEAKL